MILGRLSIVPNVRRYAKLPGSLLVLIKLQITLINVQNFCETSARQFRVPPVITRWSNSRVELHLPSRWFLVFMFAIFESMFLARASASAAGLFTVLTHSWNAFYELVIIPFTFNVFNIPASRSPSPLTQPQPPLDLYSTKPLLAPNVL